SGAPSVTVTSDKANKLKDPCFHRRTIHSYNTLHYSIILGPSFEYSAFDKEVDPIEVTKGVHACLTVYDLNPDHLRVV
ncbi:hypothetical protein N7501_001760, partial [Penicillium viridicatum]